MSVPDTFVVELQGWTQKLPTFTRGQLILRAIGSLIVGGILALLLIAMIVVLVVKHPAFSTDELSAIPITIFAWWMLSTGIRYLRHLPAGGWNDPVQFAAPYAFSLTGAVIHFPGRFDTKAEDWPIAPTTTKVGKNWVGPIVTLDCPGFKHRRYLARALALAPADVVQAIDEYRNAALFAPRQ